MLWLRSATCVAVYSDYLYAIALQFNNYFFAQLAGAQQHDFGCGGGKRCAYGGHGALVS